MITIKKPTQAIIALALAFGAWYGVRHLVSTGVIPSSSGMKTMLALPADEIKAAVLSDMGNVKIAPLPTNTPVRVCVDGNTTNCVSGTPQEIEIWAWNANMGLIFATGGGKDSIDGKGIQTSKNSLMEKYGANVIVHRQDNTGQMQADLLNTAQMLVEHPDAVGVKFITNMGDGDAQFYQGVNPKLAKLDGCNYNMKQPDNPCAPNTGNYMLETIATIGYSGNAVSGEDGFWGPAAWKNCDAMKGGLSIAVPMDGDWNIEIKKLTQCGVPNNPDFKTFDPTAMNWVSADDYLKAVEMFVTPGGYCEDRPIKGKIGGATEHICAQGVDTWTPGDANLAHKCPVGPDGKYCAGAVPIMTTKQSIFQMPCVLIGIHAWDQAHRDDIKKMLTAIFDGGAQVRVNPAALDKGGEISQILYKEPGANAAYWVKYFKGVTETDTAGVRVSLGGSRVATLADALQSFGIKCPTASCPNLYAATYTTFGKIDVQQYPNLVPSFPPANKIMDTSYVQDVLNSNVLDTTNGEQMVKQTNAPMQSVEGQRNYQIQFASGSAQILPVSIPTLNQLAADMLITNYIVAVHGYTDDAKWTGLAPDASVAKNLQLSSDRADSVVAYLKSQGVPNTLRPYPHGQDEQIPGGQAMNRRVKIVMGSSQ